VTGVTSLTELTRPAAVWQAPAWWRALAGADGRVGPLPGDQRPVLLAVVVAALLALTAPLIWVSRSQELRRKWASWLGIALVVGPLVWWGRLPAALLAGVVAVVAVAEYAHMLRLPRPDLLVLASAAVVLPLLALADPSRLGLLPLALLLTPVIPLVGGDTSGGALRAAYMTFGIVWLAWAPAHLVIVYHDAFVLALAVAVCDVGSWAGGKVLGRLPGLSVRFSPVSPNKTVGGLVGGAAAAALLLLALGEWTPALWAAVAVGAPLGDLVESLVKRQARVKDAGRWLPGFGGILDRIDSLLLVLPLAAVLTA
jgi:phosphatidate cytidylyltransferase